MCLNKFCDSLSEVLGGKGSFLTAIYLADLSGVLGIMLMARLAGDKPWLTWEKTLESCGLCSFGSFFVWLFLLTLLNQFLSPRPFIWRTAQLMLLLLCSLNSLMLLFAEFSFPELPLQDVIVIVLSADLNTVKEFCRDYLLKPEIFGGAILLFLTIQFLSRFLSRLLSKLMSRQGPRTLRFLLPTYLLFLPVLLFTLVTAPLADGNYQLGVDDQKPLWVTLLAGNTALGSTAHIALQVAQSLKGDTDILAVMDKLSEPVIDKGEDYPYIVLILGESLDRNHMSLYGYHLPTTPRLDELAQRGELAVYSDVIACANYTIKAMSLMFTFAEKGEPITWYEQPNIFDILGAAGYSRTYFSNQSPRGLWGNVGRILAKRSDEARFLEDRGPNPFVRERDPDGELLPLLDEWLPKHGDGKNFLFLHLTGSHQNYASRYPPMQFTHFTAKDEDYSEAAWRKVAAEYDNSVLYNDYVVTEIINRFRDKEALVIYLSDHGEELYDGRDFAGHSPEEAGNTHMIEIPFLLWSSESFRHKNPAKWRGICVAKDRPFMTDSLSHALLDLLGIKTKHTAPEKSLWNKNFAGDRVRLYNNAPYERGN